MQHADYRTTAKHYIDRKEIAKDMVKKVLIIYVDRSRVEPAHPCGSTHKDFLNFPQWLVV